MSVSPIKKIAVFCGSSIGNNLIYAEVAKQLAISMAHAGMALVYGGAHVGLMGVLADHVLNEKGHVVGVIPQSLVDVEIAHPGLTELHIVHSMHERKAKIADMSDGFILLPGGPGSLDEFFEMITFAQLGYHSKPCGILNVNGYYDYLLKFLDQAVDHGFMKAVYRHMIIVEQSPPVLLHKFNHYQAPSEKKWMNFVDTNTHELGSLNSVEQQS
jgi:uncharacterized protein (TIGR00730 family)